ncbi:MAG: hypothetical protein KA885_01455 [Spirochaetes bacterium]|nr:hypothetical protein [Spirochaetota bacterium]
MTITKNEIFDIVKDLPDNMEIENLMEIFYVREKISKGKKDIDAGNYKTQEELEEIIKQW